MVNGTEHDLRFSSDRAPRYMYLKDYSGERVDGITDMTFTGED